MSRNLTHVIGFDDSPFLPSSADQVRLIGAVFCGARLEGVMQGMVHRDGSDSTSVIAGLVSGSRFRTHLQAILLQGITVAGFNVVDIHGLHQATGLPVIVVVRHRPHCRAIRTALLDQVTDGGTKWRLIERAGPMETVLDLHVQRVGVDLADVERLIKALSINSRIPEPLRTAHIIAAGVSELPSRKRV